MPTTVDRTGLRPLSAEEEGTSIDHLPAGVYGFTYAPLTESPIFSKENYHCFEMQKLAGGAGRLIAWVTPAEAARIREGKASVEAYVYPEQWNDATEQVDIPVARASRKNRNPIREEGGRVAIIVDAK